MWPMSQDYNEAIQSPQQCFADAELKQGEAVCNAMGLPVPCSGNFADVYAVGTPQRKWAVKCFTRQIPGLQERYKEIGAYLKQVPLPFMVDFSFHEQGIRVRGLWYPILKMQWVEGSTLNAFVKARLDKPQTLDVLSQLWVRLSSTLRESQMAHCDLQHGNVLLVPGSKAGALAIKLVDYDGMCVPSLTLLKTIEVGHPNFQHPQRAREGVYSLEVDRFSHLVIFTALRALIGAGPELWEKYDNGDNLLFKQADFEAPAKSRLFNELLGSGDAAVRQLAETMMRALAKPLNQTPPLPELASRLPLTKRTPSRADDSTAEDLFAAATSPPPRRSQLRRRGGVPAWAWAAGVAGLIAVMGGLFFAMSGKPESKEPAVTQKNPEDTKKSNTDKDKDRQPKDNTKEPKDKGKEPDKDKELMLLPKEGEEKTVDLLKLVDMDAGNGWSFQGSTLVSPKLFVAKVPIAYVPPQEYDLKVVLERKDGYVAGIGLVCQGQRCILMLDDKPELGWRSGLEIIDGKSLGESPLAHKGQTLKDNTASVVLIRVRKAGLTATVDGKKIVDFKGDYKRLSVREEMAVPSKEVIFLSIYQGVFLFKKMELTTVSGEGKTLAGSGSGIYRSPVVGRLGKAPLAEYLKAGGKSFEDRVEQGAFVIGLRARTRFEELNRPEIAYLHAIYSTPSGKKVGPGFGHEPGSKQHPDVEAKDGYAVGGLMLWSSEIAGFHLVRGMKVQFMRRKEQVLDPKDSYWSEWIGLNGEGKGVILGGDGNPVVGIQGMAGGAVDCLGIVQLR